VDERDDGANGNGAGAPADPDRPAVRPTVSVDVLQALVDFLDDVVERPSGAGTDAGARTDDE
jgi:hypothetical protein